MARASRSTMPSAAPPAKPGAPDPYQRIGNAVTTLPLDFPRRRSWWIMFALSAALFGLYVLSAGVLFYYGVGVWGVNIPVNWALAIANYIWWLGIGHAGTLISAMLLILNQSWRNSLNRFAEAMTLFAVVCAGFYPILHLGRPWFLYWMAPYPSTMGVWPQFRSPLTWDFFAVLTYLIVSALFWYLGIIPDLASTRDRARTKPAQVIYGLMALGWRGQASHWVRWRTLYRLTAAIAVPLVVSVHSEISLLLAAGPVIGWNSSVFPPYFVLGAAFSGFAVVSMITVVLRHALYLKSLVTAEHLNLLGLMTLISGLMTGFGYFAEVFTTLWAGDRHEMFLMFDRFTGPVAWAYWGAVIGNFGPLQLLWLRKVRTAPIPLFLISLCVVVGMWFERFMLVVTGLHRSGLPSSWHSYTPSFWEWSLFAGSLGLFLTLFLLFMRLMPVISTSELKEEVAEATS